MPDRMDSFGAAEPATAPTLAARSFDMPKTLSVAFPLDDFYMRAGRRLPAVETLAADDLPEPYRSLLAHRNDMTPTLSAFHARIIHLRVLSRQQRDDFYFREVVLVSDGTEEPVEFGAIRINLALFSSAVRRQIIDERVPLGHLLRVHAIPHSSRPRAFFRLEADKFMTEALELTQPRILYGRRNTLLNGSQRPLAEVVEILPPVPEPPAGFLAPTQERP